MDTEKTIGCNICKVSTCERGGLNRTNFHIFICCNCCFDKSDDMCPSCLLLSQPQSEHASKPEPPPLDNGDEVTPALIGWLETIKHGSTHYTRDINDTDITLAVDLIKARDAYGFGKYGQHLKTRDGRDTQEDAIQELGDLLQYVFKAKLNGENIDKIKQLLPILVELIGTDGPRELDDVTIYNNYRNKMFKMCVKYNWANLPGSATIFTAMPLLAKKHADAKQVWDDYLKFRDLFKGDPDREERLFSALR